MTLINSAANSCKKIGKFANVREKPSELVSWILMNDGKMLNLVHMGAFSDVELSSRLDPTCPVYHYNNVHQKSGIESRS